MLLLVILVAGLALFLLRSGPNVASLSANQRANELLAQAQLITHRITKCATDYPLGNNGQGLHLPYPADANPGALAVSSLVCPGSGQNLWSGVDGVYLPPAIAEFNGWMYTNASPATVSITAVHATAHASTLATVAARIGAAASSTANTLTVKVIQ